MQLLLLIVVDLEEGVQHLLDDRSVKLEAIGHTQEEVKTVHIDFF